MSETYLSHRAIRSYSPIDDLEKFTDAVYTRQIKL